MPNQIQQVLIVLCILAALPLACRILAKLKLLPLAVYLLVTNLIFPQWAAEHETLYAVLLVGLVVLTLALWLAKPLMRRRSDRAVMAQVVRQVEQARQMGLRDDQYSIQPDASGIPRLVIKQ